MINLHPPNSSFNAEDVLEDVTSTPRSNGKKRSGKKRRIAIRMKIQAAQRNREERVIAEREKKTRMNRGKKVRRKMKEKATKLEKGEEAQDDG